MLRTVLVLGLLLGFGQQCFAKDPLTPLAKARFIGLAAATLARATASWDTSNPSPPDGGGDDVETPKTCSVCNGTRRSGDGLGPCPCQDNCQCRLGSAAPKVEEVEETPEMEETSEMQEEPIIQAPAERPRRLLFFMKPNDQASMQMAKDFRVLADPLRGENRWDIGVDPMSHIQIIDTTTEAGHQWQLQYGAEVPELVLLAAGQVMAREKPSKTPLTSHQIAELYNSGEIKSRVIAAAAAAAQPRQYVSIYGIPFYVKSDPQNFELLRQHIISDHGIPSGSLAGYNYNSLTYIHGDAHELERRGYRLTLPPPPAAQGTAPVQAPAMQQPPAPQQVPALQQAPMPQVSPMSQAAPVQQSTVRYMVPTVRMRSSSGGLFSGFVNIFRSDDRRRRRSSRGSRYHCNDTGCYLYDD